MKQVIILTLLFTVCLNKIYSQIPQKINYQAVARDASGVPLKNKSISVRISILNTSATGSIAYQEKHTTQTNDYGHFNLEIGGGTVEIGIFKNITWDKSDKFLLVEFDPNGGINYIAMGSTQLLSVPYAIVSDKANALTSGAKISLNQINGAGVTSGQVLQFNGTDWVPTTITSGGVGDNWGTQTAIVNSSLKGNGTVSNPIGLPTAGVTNGQIMQYNGTAWVPTTINTNVVEKDSVIGNEISDVSTNGGLTRTGTGTAASPFKVGLISGTATGQSLQWNGTSWVLVSNATADNWGTQTATTTSTLSGNGTTTSPLTIAQQGASSGQVLSWNGTTWIPVFIIEKDSIVGNEVTDTITGGGLTLSGSRTAISPLKIGIKSGTANGQVLTWNATTQSWSAQTPTADNWGSQVVNTNSTLSGEGTANAPLSISQQGATLGQVLQWNGTAWIPATLSGSGTGDNWGIQTVVTNPSLIGLGTTGSPLKIDSTYLAKLVAKAPVKDSIINIINANATSTTASNGLAKSGNNITLGGGLTVPTTITTSSTNTLAISGLSSGTTSDSIMVADATSGVIKRIAPSRVGTTYSSNNGVTQTGTNFSLGGTLSAPVGLTTTSNNTLSILGLGSGTISDSIVVADATTGTLKRISSGRIAGSGGSYTSNNGITLTGSNFKLGGALTGATSIATTATNTLALTGLSSSGTTDSILSVHPTTGIIGRMNPSRFTLWSKDINDNISYKNGNVSIGTDTSKTKLYVYNNTTASDTAAFIYSTSPNPNGTLGLVVKVDNTSTNNSGFAIWAGSNNGGVIGDATASASVSGHNHTGVRGFAYNNPQGNLNGVFGYADSSNAISFGVAGNAHTVGVFGRSSFNSTTSSFTSPYFFNLPTKYGVLGYQFVPSVSNTFTSVGVGGISFNSNVNANYGVMGLSYGNIGTSQSVGVYAKSGGGDTFQIAVYGALDTPTRVNSLSFAGLFNGKLQTTGVLVKASGTFKIDHPQDPENKYLVHSFVESPDMMNVYNGNIVTDKDGLAVVTLPEYFETLNKDFRYQLTAVQSFSQLMIKEKIKENKFVIQSEKPNVEVSWQVTGIRKDPFAEKNRVVDVEEKKGYEKGRYLHPELYDQPREKGLFYELTPKTSNATPTKVEDEPYRKMGK